MFDAQEKVAYLFTLRRNRHPLPRVWNTYFKGCPKDSYIVRLHVDPSAVTAVPHSRGAHAHAEQGPSNSGSHGDASRGDLLQGVFRDKAIPSCTTVRRFEYSMVKARLLLLQNASAHAASPGWYFFFSESCAPLVPCTRVHNFLQQHQGKSFVQSRSGSEARPVHEVRRRMRNSHLPLSAYRETYGWLGLWREQVQALLAMESENEATFGNTSLPDEWYWPTIMERKGMQTWRRLLTYETWLNTNLGGHPDTFVPRNLSAVRARALDHGDLFARKFVTTPAMDDALVRELSKPQPPRNMPGGLASDYAASGLNALV